MIIRMGKAKYMWITAVPMAFLVVTTITAAYLNIVTNYLPKGNMLLVTLSAMIILLAVIIVVDSVLKWFKMLKKENVTA